MNVRLNIENILCSSMADALFLVIDMVASIEGDHPPARAARALA